MADLTQDFACLLDTVRGFGVEKGDILYVASDITRLMYRVSHLYNDAYDEYMDGLVNTLQEVVGAEGTLLFPVFTWDFCRGKGHVLKETKGEVGTFNNWILKKRHDFRRTAHPMYSFMVWGKDANLLCSMNNRDAWGEDSPFAYLRENSAKTLIRCGTGKMLHIHALYGAIFECSLAIHKGVCRRLYRQTGKHRKKDIFHVCARP